MPQIDNEDLGRLVSPFAAVAAQNLSDVAFLLARFGRAHSVRSALAWTDDLRTSVHEVSETMMGVAFTASLTGFRVKGVEWRHALVSPNSEADEKLARGLEDLRYTLMQLAETLPRYLLDPRFDLRVKRSLSILYLALDACHPPQLINKTAVFAGCRWDDVNPRRTAMQAAEDFHLDPELSVVRMPEDTL